MKLASEKQEMLFQISLTTSMAGQAWFAPSKLPSDPLPSYATTRMQARFIHEGTVCVIRGESSCLNFFTF